MGSQCLVSVIIPLYNAEKYIAETLQSVVVQTYNNWELIVVDDCSSDNSPAIVNDFSKRDSRIKLITLDKNFGGPSKPRNVGVENSGGEYIAFLDADDIWLPNKLEDQIAFMQENGLDFSSTDRLCFNQIGDIPDGIKYRLRLSLFGKKISIKTSMFFNLICTSSVIVKNRGCLPTFNEDRELIAVEDMYCWLELFERNYKYQLLRRKLIRYRVVSTSISAHDNRKVIKLRHAYAINKFILAKKRFDLYWVFFLKACFLIKP